MVRLGGGRAFKVRLLSSEEECFCYLAQAIKCSHLRLPGGRLLVKRRLMGLQLSGARGDLQSGDLRLEALIYGR